MFGKISYDEYIEMIEKFHGTASPGIIMGGFMINVAFKNKPSDVFLM